MLYAKCPSGHRLRAGRRSWIEGPSWAPSLTARFEGRCERCHADVEELVRLELPPPPPRGLSGAELDDPAVLRRRIDSARLELERPDLHPALREQLRRDYTERPPGFVGQWPDPALERAADVLRRRTIGAGPDGDAGGEGSSDRPAD